MSESDRIATLIEELKDLRVQETSLLQQIEDANRRRGNGQEVNGTSSDRSTQAYQTGDRVYITSRIRRPVFATRTWTGHKERRATVTRVVGEKVFVQTDNGTETWRAAKNLQALPL